MTLESVKRETEPAPSSKPVRRRRKEARPAEIIEASLAEFALHGFAGTRIEDVARRAGVAKGTIYLYFPDKEALFLAAARSRANPVTEGIAVLLDTFPGTTRELLRLMFTEVHRGIVGSDLKILLRIVIGEGERFPTLTGFYYEEIVSRGRALLERVVRRGIERGEVREGAVASLPIVIMAPAIMAALWYLAFERHASIPPEAFLAAHCDLVFGGLLIPEHHW